MSQRIVDEKKRRTLAIMAGTTAAALLPTVATAATNPLKLDSSSKDSSVAINSSDDDLEISLDLDGSPTLFIKNKTDKLVIVRHVHPGIVHVNGSTFDINSLFESSASAIGGHRTRRYQIEATHPLASERPFPRRLISSKPVRVTAISGGTDPAEQLNTPRNFFFS